MVQKPMQQKGNQNNRIKKSGKMEPIVGQASIESIPILQSGFIKVQGNMERVL